MFVNFVKNELLKNLNALYFSLILQCRNKEKNMFFLI